MSPNELQGTNEGRNAALVPFLISLTCHLILFGLILFKPNWGKSEPGYFPSVIDVHMVGMPAGGGPSNPKPAPAAKKAPEQTTVQTAAPEKQPESIPSKAPEISTQEAAKPEISVSQQPSKKIKVALKYKTYKPEKALQQALDKLENKVESTPPSEQASALQDTLKRLREEVTKSERSDAGGGDTTAQGPGAGARTGSGLFGSGGGQIGGPEQIYQAEVAFQIQKNWAYSEQVAGLSKNMVAKIIFKVLPDGRIVDISFTERSGNAHLDESGYKAIVKSSPVKPFPPELNKPYTIFGINFGPEGVQ